jgi:tRNA (mo5U34)-methyltransferase
MRLWSDRRQSREERLKLQRDVERVPFWWHSIDLGDGVVTPGHKTPDVLARELEALRLPNLRGRSVLDIGGWDGFFAFEAERRGARRVAVLDHYMWSMDIIGQQGYWGECAERGEEPQLLELTEFWHPDTMPGRRGFNTAREALNSQVEPIALDFMSCDLGEIGEWDVVLYLGVLYHMQNPLLALRRVHAVTGASAIIETEAVVVPAHEHEALWRFFPGTELNHDISNWWAPNMTGLTGALRSAGFSEVEVVQGPPEPLLELSAGIGHYRAIVHAST